MTTAALKVSPSVMLHLYYDRPSRAWWAHYADLAGNQLGESWFGTSRDHVLVFRPDVPAV